MFTCVTVTVDKLLITCFRKVNGRKMILGMKCDGEARVGHTLRNVLSLECQQALGMRSCFPFRSNISKCRSTNSARRK